MSQKCPYFFVAIYESKLHVVVTHLILQESNKKKDNTKNRGKKGTSSIRYNRETMTTSLLLHIMIMFETYSQILFFFFVNHPSSIPSASLIQKLLLLLQLLRLVFNRNEDLSMIANKNIRKTQQSLSHRESYNIATVLVEPFAERGETKHLRLIEHRDRQKHCCS